MYGEAHSAGGVYPTPPDGLSSHHVSSMGSLDASAHAMAEANSLGGSVLGADINNAMSMDQDHANQYGHISQFQEKQPFSNEISGGMEGDLFGDMDDDDFGGNDITDADFSFFDQPDALDAEMQPTEISLGPESQGADQTTNDDLVKAEDDEATNAVHSPKDVHSNAAHTEAGASRELSEPVPPSSAQNNPTPPNNDNIQFERLDPVEVKKRLFLEDRDVSNPNNDNPPLARSIFRPLIFRSDIDLVDAKYSSTGQFAFNSSNMPKKRTHPDANPVFSIALPSTSRKNNIKRFRGAMDLPMLQLDRESDSSDPASDSDSLPDETESRYPQSPLKGMMRKQTATVEMITSPSISVPQLELGMESQLELVGSTPYQLRLL
jgi:mediator of RNA polymerase II transcription subunit 13